VVEIKRMNEAMSQLRQENLLLKVPLLHNCLPDPEHFSTDSDLQI
jgi:hypothetical protein